MTNSHSIKHFMWRYQQHFGIRLAVQADKVLQEIAPDLKPEALLVGVHESAGRGFPVCVEPETGPWPVDLFDGLHARIEEIRRAHPGQQVIYGDAPSNERKPRVMLDDAIRDAVQARLDTFDREHRTITFCGLPGQVTDRNEDGVGTYSVVPALQFDRTTFSAYPSLTATEIASGPYRDHVVRSLLESVIEVLLADARKELLADEPGRLLGEERRDPTDILRSAGRTLMNRVGLVGGLPAQELFDAFTTIAALRHERSESVGGVVLAASNHPAVERVIGFARPIPLRAPNWARKILQLTTNDLYLLSDTSEIFGLGRIGAYDAEREDLFRVEFIGFHRWDLRHGDAVLMRTAFSVPGLPKARFERTRFLENARQLFGEATVEDAARIWEVVEAAGEQKKGTMVVVAANAIEEARRLATQATPIDPRQLTTELVRQVSGIDGAILLDPHGVCHAIGVILDGQASGSGDPARGARYNSAVRYVSTAEGRALAVVISEDGSFDVLPLLPSRVSRADVARTVADLRAMVQHGSWANLPEVRERLKRYRFYFSAEQCAQINLDLKALRATVIAAGELWLSMQEFVAHPAMNDDFFINDHE